MRSKHKNGFISIGTLVTLVLLIVGFAFVSLWIDRGFAQAKGPAAEIICRSSVIAKNLFGIRVGVGGVAVEEHPTPLLCHEQEVTLKKDTETVKKELATMATKCWWQFAKGRYRKTFEVGTNEIYCFVCYYIKIEDSRGFSRFTGHDLERWMQENTYSQPVEFAKREIEEGVPVSKATSYYNYIVREESGEGVVGWLITEPNLDFDKGGVYAITYVEPHSSIWPRTNYIQNTDMNGIVIAKADSIVAIPATGKMPDYCTVLRSGIGGE
jgi:hypothetical protein